MWVAGNSKSWCKGENRQEYFSESLLNAKKETGDKKEEWSCHKLIFWQQTPAPGKE